MIILSTNIGDIVVDLDFKSTPKSAENFLYYVESGFYEGTLIHRVIPNFIIQGGGFLPKMIRKPPLLGPIVNEAAMGRKNERGTLAYARQSDPHSAASQFLINVVDNPFLDHLSETPAGWGYCVFGWVIEGMEVVDRIRKLKTASRLGYTDVPVEDVIIKKAFVASKAVA